MTSSEHIKHQLHLPTHNAAVGHYLGDCTDIVDLRGVVMLVHLLTDVEQERCIFLIALHPQGHEALHRLQQLQLPVLQLHQTLVGVAQVPAEPHLARKARTLSLSLVQWSVLLRSALLLLLKEDVGRDNNWLVEVHEHMCQVVSLVGFIWFIIIYNSLNVMTLKCHMACNHYT